MYPASAIGPPNPKEPRRTKYASICPSEKGFVSSCVNDVSGGVPAAASAGNEVSVTPCTILSGLGSRAFSLEDSDLRHFAPAVGHGEEQAGQFRHEQRGP